MLRNIFIFVGAIDALCFIALTGFILWEVTSAVWVHSLAWLGTLIIMGLCLIGIFICTEEVEHD